MVRRITGVNTEKMSGKAQCLIAPSWLSSTISGNVFFPFHSVEVIEDSHAKNSIGKLSVLLKKCPREAEDEAFTH